MPALPPDEIDATILRLRSEGEGWSAIGHVVGLSRDSVSRRHAKLMGSMGLDDHPGFQAVTEGNVTRIEPVARYRPKPAEIKRLTKDKSAFRDTLSTLRELLLGDIRAASLSSQAINHSKPRIKWAPESERHLLEIAPVDLHVGKLSWGEETGHDYDIRIAERVFTDAIDEILARVQGLTVEQIVLVVGNDLTQTDNLAGTTTAGTFVDTDTRYIKAFRRAVAINRWAIERCASVAPVLVKIIPGNHDRLTAFHVGDVLAAAFEGRASISIDNSPKLRKYHHYGVNLLGWTHGSEERQADLPLIMAQEEPEAWAATKWREIHTGHYHKAKEMRYTAGDSFNGVRVRILPSLCGPDAWHFARGFVHEQRACEAFIWNRTRGYAGHLSANARDEAA